MKESVAVLFGLLVAFLFLSGFYAGINMEKNKIERAVFWLLLGVILVIPIICIALNYSLD